MLEVTTLFAHDAEGRTPETDQLAEELIRHRHMEKFPTSTPPSVEWVRHYQPDCWLVFATGEIDD